MGLLGSTTQAAYYQGSDFGTYQFVSLDSIINNFMYIYVGENKIISKVNRTDVQFHAVRALQELSYDVLKSFKSQEIEVPNTLTMVLPQDYVNYRKIARVGSDGIERPLYPTRHTSNPFAITQAADGTYTIDPTSEKRKYEMRVPGNLVETNPDGSTETTLAGARIADGDYLSLSYLDESGAEQNMFFIFNSDGDINDGANPAGSLPGPRFEVAYTTSMNRGQLLNALKTAIDTSKRFTTEIVGDLLTAVNKFDGGTEPVFYVPGGPNQQIGFFPASMAIGTVSSTHITSPEALILTETADNNSWAFSSFANGDSSTFSLVEQTPSDTLSNFQDASPVNYNLYDINYASDVEISVEGRRYGLEPELSQMNGSFYIDNLRGKIHFGSALSGQTIVLHYVSDGLGTDEEMIIHKFCEEACYKHIMYGILSGRSNIPEYIVQRYKKEKFAETRKAKIRLSNIKIEEFTQVVKGMGKQIK